MIKRLLHSPSNDTKGFVPFDIRISLYRQVNGPL